MKILYVTTISDTVDAFLVPYILELIMRGHEVDIACKIQKPIAPELLRGGCKVYNIPFSRSPFSKDNLAAYRQLKAIISTDHYDIVHTHTPNASACARLACRNLRKTGLRVIYTVHGFHFYKGAPLINWLIFFPAERWMSPHTDVLVTINKEDFAVAKERLKAKTAVYIPGVGVNAEKFSAGLADRSAKRRMLELPVDAFVVLSVGELNQNKNQEIVIRAIGKLKDPNIFYLIAGIGEKENRLREIAENCGAGSRVKLLGFRTDIAELCKAADLFCQPSRREGLPVALMEAMASGLPCVCSNIRGCSDLIDNGLGGYLCSPDSVNGFADAIKRLSMDPVRCDWMKTYNEIKIKDFDVAAVMEQTLSLYQ